jgi:hypothetical protein
MSFDFREPEQLLPCVALVAAVLSLGYCAVRARNWREDFGLVDAAILFLAMATGTAAAVPFINGAQRQASATAMMGELHILRTQIALYQAEHGGNAPLLFQGGFPQLTQPTNAAGVPGSGGSNFPLGPYFPSGIPANPMTGVATVTAVAEFPPKAPTGARGWVYHQATGRIAPDVDGYVGR